MTARDDKDREKTGRENLGRFFYDLAKTTFAVMVLGNTMSIFGMTEFSIKSIYMALLGVIITSLFASIGNRILTRK